MSLSTSLRCLSPRPARRPPDAPFGTPLADQSQIKAAVQALQADKAGANTARIQYTLAGRSLARRFDNPKVDPHTPDIIIQPTPGAICSTSTAKVMEHGGFAMDDAH